MKELHTKTADLNKLKKSKSCFFRKAGVPGCHEGSPADRMLPNKVRSFRAFSTSFSSIFRNTCRNILLFNISAEIRAHLKTQLIVGVLH